MLRGLLLVMAIILTVFLWRGWTSTVSPGHARRAQQWVLVAGMGALALLVGTRFPWAMLLFGVALPFLFRHGQSPTVGEQGPGQQSTIETATVRMQLNHDSGQLDGRVITGPHQGSALSKLRQEQLIDLLKHCQKHDFDSVPLLEAYLDRYFEHWRQQKEQPSDDNFDSGEMTKQQAYSILGLEPGASAENIRTTHKRLIQRLHPDRGGSAYLAAKINQAKDSLLK